MGMEMDDSLIDDSFKKPGTIPFKWEIRPGVPKIQQREVIQEQKQQPQQKQLRKQLSPPILPSPLPPLVSRRRPSPTLQKLKPPPAGSILLPPPERCARSFRSTPRTRSERWRFEQPTLARAECVSPGCFPSPSLRRKDSKRTTPIFTSEPDCTYDLETLARWSVSSRKSFSPFTNSPASSFSSYQSSPRLVRDADWAGFGLF